MATVPPSNLVFINYQPGELWDCQSRLGWAHSAHNCSEMRCGLMSVPPGWEALDTCVSSWEKGWRSLSQTQPGEIHQIQEEQALYPHKGCVRPPGLHRAAFVGAAVSPSGVTSLSAFPWLAGLHFSKFHGKEVWDAQEGQQEGPLGSSHP